MEIVRRSALSAFACVFVMQFHVQTAFAASESERPYFKQTTDDVPGRRIALIQRVLADRKLYTCAIDGLFGPQTTSADKSFQTTKAMKTVDGIVGSETGKALGLPFWDKRIARRLDPPFRDEAKYPQSDEFNFKSLVESGNFFSGQPDAEYNSSNSLTRRALRTNNPGAINLSKWQRDSMKGYVGSTLPGPAGNKTAIYESPEYGIAAWGFLLRKIYFSGKKEKVTVGDIVDKYRGTNSRAPYIDGYKKYSNGKLTEDYVIDLYDNKALAELALAAFSHELGFWYPVTDQQLLRGLALTDSYIDEGITDNVVVAPEEMDPAFYLRELEAEAVSEAHCPGNSLSVQP
jgi:D-alanyl-D-alanine carboxypeptidase